MLGVASLPDNEVVKKVTKEEGEEKVEEDEVMGSELRSSLVDQLRMSFSKLKDSEKDYQEGVEAVSVDIEQVKQSY